MSDDLIRKFASPSILPESGDYVSPAGNEGNPEGGGEGKKDIYHDFIPSPYWELYKNKLPEDQREGFQLPEDLTRENEQELLDKHLSKVYSKEPTFNGLHPLAKEIQERYQSGDLDVDKFIADKYGSFNLNNYTDDEILFASYKERVGKSEANPTGFDDDKIREELGRLNALDKRQMADQIRQSQAQRLRESYSVNNEEVEKERMKAYLKEVDQNVESIFKRESERGAEAASIRTFAGIDIGEANFQAMKDEYRRLITPDKNGQIPLAVKLQDENIFFRLAMLEKYEEIFRDSITKARTEGKQVAINQLPKIAPNIGAGVGASNEPMSLDEAKRRLGSPSGSI